MNVRIIASVLIAVCFAALAAPLVAQLPPPLADDAMAEWAFPWADDVPGQVSAAALIDKPAGKHGPVVARDGHFFVGEKRIRFVGVNLAFAGNFPAKEQADALAKRFASFGVNCVRFHHMDNQPFPSGILADREFEKFSPEALDRLDYFVAALKKEGVYTNLNLHVSRQWSRAKKWPNAEKLEGYDKQVDIFHPELIEANKRYARDLLTHVNAYTKTRYADEPAVAMVEINNEDTIFLWGGEQNLASLPEPYAEMLQKQWNDWLLKKYGTREKLAAAWAQGAEPLGPALVDSPWEDQKQWKKEQHGAAKMEIIHDPVVTPNGSETRVKVLQVDGTDWHLQYSRPGVKLKQGKFYTVVLRASALKPRPVGVAVSMAHAPWGNLGLSRVIHAGGPDDNREVRLGFVASADDDNARIQFTLGGSAEPVSLFEVTLHQGGREGLRKEEDPSAGSVARGGMGSPDAPQRSRDWYRFLQFTDESYFVGMRDWLRSELGVKAPITGTIGLGMLGTKSQSRMDFVDAHAYWDHPHFPRRQWDMKDWEIKNKPMVDDPAGATLWPLAATRVAGKPFTVTEYNHAAPNEWQAECVPMIFAYAALQDWDAVFLFDYTGDTKYQKQHTANFFSIEGNAAKMATLPLAARLFLSGAVPPLGDKHVDHSPPEIVLDNASRYFYQQWPYQREVRGLKWDGVLNYRLMVSFEPKTPAGPDAPSGDTGRIAWTASGAGTGRFVVRDKSAAVFAGFAKGELPIDLGPSVKLSKLETPFATVQVVPGETGKTLANADRLLISAVARQGNAGMQWDEKRTSVSNQWGKPPAKVEVVRGELSVASRREAQVWALGPDGKRTKEIVVTAKDGWLQIPLGSEPTVWYEVVRK